VKTVGIAIDSWKMEIFHVHLTNAGYTYTRGPGLTKDTILLQVKVEFVAPLQKVIEAAQKECFETKKGPKNG